MRSLLAGMGKPKVDLKFDRETFLGQLEDHGQSFAHLKTCMFSHMRVAIYPTGQNPLWTIKARLARNYIRFGGGIVVGNEEDDSITHMIIPKEQHASGFARTGKIKTRKLAHNVGVEWVEKCWAEGTRVDEERFRWG
jgi:DNA ligase-4